MQYSDGVEHPWNGKCFFAVFYFETQTVKLRRLFVENSKSYILQPKYQKYIPFILAKHFHGYFQNEVML